MPREIGERGVLRLNRGISVFASSRDPEDEFTAEDLIGRMKERGIDARTGESAPVRVVLLRVDTRKATEILAHFHQNFDAAMHDEGYILIAGGNTTYDIAATGAGLYYGAQTVAQLVVGNGSTAELHSALVRDWPAMKYRGVSDDLSRGPMPTLEFQKHQIRTFSQYKININTIAPGATLTERTVSEPGYESTWSRITPLGKPASVEDIANAALFLVSDAAKHITGQTLIIDGGWTSVSPSPY